MITCFRNDFAGQRAEKGAGAEANRRSKDVSLGYRRTSYRLPHPICAERYLHIVALRGASRKDASTKDLHTRFAGGSSTHGLSIFLFLLCPDSVRRMKYKND